MAKQSVTASKTDEVFSKLVQGMEGLRDASRANNGGVERIGRCKHDVTMVNEVDARLLKITAVTDLLMSSRSDDLAKGTISNIGWLLADFAAEIRAIVCETKEVTA